MAATFIHDARRAVFLEAGLAFLGISDPTTPSWGRMIQQALAFTFMDAWRWWLTAPGVAISTTILGFSLCGIALESATQTHLEPIANRSGRLTGSYSRDHE
jgi:peptide/nickel transport system permease protein